MSDGGKGSAPRPITDREQFDKNWERIFGGVSSPCVEVCEIDYVKKVCAGCYRTLDEIAAWGYANDNEKRRILNNIKDRKRHAENAFD